MKTILSLLPFLLFFQGCLYFNDRGVSSHLYDNCHSYYDENGEFIEKCDENIIDYDEAKDGVIALKDEIKDDLNNFKDNISKKIDKLTDKEKEKGINIKELTTKERYELLKQNPQTTTIKEEIESSQCPCK